MKAEQGPEAGTVVGGAEEGETRLLSQTVPEEALVVHRSLTWICSCGIWVTKTCPSKGQEQFDLQLGGYHT